MAALLFTLLSEGREGEITAKAVGQVPAGALTPAQIAAVLEDATVQLRGWQRFPAKNGKALIGAEVWAILTPAAQGSLVDNLALYHGETVLCLVRLEVPITVNAESGQVATLLTLLSSPGE